MDIVSITQTILFLNALWDFACYAGALMRIDTVMKLHRLWKSNDQVIDDLMAHFVLACGFMRLAGASHPLMLMLASASYLCEAGFCVIAFEQLHKRMTVWILATSLMLWILTATASQYSVRTAPQ